MVSSVKFYSFKELDLKGRVPFVMIVLAVMVIALISADPPKILLAGFVLYACSGVFAFIRRWVKRRRELKKDLDLKN
jgi:CDP-diacylglycerol--serine O-phosphatidyltransferase